MQGAEKLRLLCPCRPGSSVGGTRRGTRRPGHRRHRPPTVPAGGVSRPGAECYAFVDLGTEPPMVKPWSRLVRQWRLPAGRSAGGLSRLLLELRTDILQEVFDGA